MIAVMPYYLIENEFAHLDLTPTVQSNSKQCITTKILFKLCIIEMENESACYWTGNIRRSTIGNCVT